MALVEYVLKTKRHKKVQIDIFPLATMLWNEFEQNGLLDRMKAVPQLGAIRIKNHEKKTRYDYVMLQLYLHQIIKAELKDYMLYTYNNLVQQDGFYYYSADAKKNKVTIADVIQLVILCYSCGVFFNSFVASRAAAMLASDNATFSENFLSSFQDERFRCIANQIIDRKDYYHWQLLNAASVLEHCNPENDAVRIAKEILILYLSKSQLADEKMSYIFTLFSKVRDISFIAYDLQTAKAPFSIDLTDSKAMLILLREYISEYNDRKSTNELIKAIKKLLDDVLYSNFEDEIAYFQISNEIVRQFKKSSVQAFDYYSDFIMDPSGIFNRHYAFHRDYDADNILKLTFNADNQKESQRLIDNLQHMNHVRIGYYNRYSGEKTVLIAIKKSCKCKLSAAFRILKSVIAVLRKTSDGNQYDVRYILCSRFFLFYLFNCHPVRIFQTIDREKCVICTRGFKSRRRELEKLLSSRYGSIDEIHEAEFLLTRLYTDNLNDTCITIPASIKVYPQEKGGSCLAEFDGMIIYPFRQEKQVVFLEAKNTTYKPSFAQKCLRKKLHNLQVPFDETACIRIGHDAFIDFSI